MTWKKNWFSRILWVFQLVTAAIFLTGVSGIFLDKYKIAEMYEIMPGYNRLIWLGIICFLFFISSLVLYLIVRLIAGRTGKLNVAKSAKIAGEILMLAGLLSVGVLYRLALFPDPLESNPYFELAAVNSTQMPAPLAHGALYIYILLLHGLFMVVGNNLLAGIILQLVLQFAAAVLVYFAVRKIAGVLPAIWTFGFFMSAPIFVKESLIYSPVNLYLLLFGVVLLFFAALLNVIKNVNIFRWYHYIAVFLFGISVSFLIYSDAVGMVLLVICISMLGVCGQEKKKPVLPLLVLALLGVVLGLLGIFAVDAWQSNSNLSAIAGVWGWLFIPESYINFSYMFSQLFSKLGDNLVVSVLIFAGIAWGIFGFFSEKKKESQSMWVLLALSAILLSCVCPAAGNMDRSFPALLGMIILAGKGLQLAFSNKKTEEFPVEEVLSEELIADEVIPDEIIAEEPVAEEPEEPVAEEIIAEESFPVREIKYIENPLPLPKKHVKKTMDYGYEIPEEQLVFDIEISDDDDFDF